MRIAAEEWLRFIPGVRMYQGKQTLFYNGEMILWDEENEEFLIYDEEERDSWEVIIVLPGVQVIPEDTFKLCYRVKIVVMSDSVRRIEKYAFFMCTKLEFVKLSGILEFIGEAVFLGCHSLISIFVPPSCRQIDRDAFWDCQKLIICNIPENTQLGESVFGYTALLKASPFRLDFETEGLYVSSEGRHVNYEAVNEWVKNHKAGDQFSLHRACSSFNPLDEVIFEIIGRQGIGALKIPDNSGVTPSQYLSTNPFTDIKETLIMKHYILRMMGEIV
ncbi:hypothetical protein CTEN210_13647 [Chaetoceros tenuissimus]|uniref:Leucine-rich repeat domain-containing protein n=1 Tax=Chaetoceros tenuissimus TaxID=426638 RepID=A0AAD3D5Q4_9STRA|nr:hypothetical protein CTEN210_13647 [Chaetoceros tenuissimus]